MQYSIVNKSRLHGNLRIDAEFYLPNFLQLEKTLNSHQIEVFSTYSIFIKKGIFDLSPDFYREQGIPLIRTSEIKDPQIDFSSTVFLDEKTQALNRKTELTPGDIVFTKIGAYIGDVAMLPEKYGRYNFSQNVTGVKLKKDIIMPGFLLAYLLSKYGNGQIKRIIMLSGQGKLELKDVKDIKVVLLGEKIKALTHKIVLQAELLKEKSVNIYREAEQILLSDLNLLNWKPKHRLSFVKNYSDTRSASRVDAEYFQPKYEKIVKAIKKYNGGWDTLGNLLNIKDKNFNPVDKKEYRYIELSNIGGNGEVTGHTTAEGQELPTRARRKVCANDVIISSIEGSLSSIALITKECDNALCSTGFYVVNSDDMNSETMLVLLKSQVGQEQLKKGCSGTILTAINKDELEKIILPMVDKKVQAKIQQKITESFYLRKESKHLLECAKKAVEMAIEQDEKTAERWIKRQAEKLKI